MLDVNILGGVHLARRLGVPRQKELRIAHMSAAREGQEAPKVRRPGKAVEAPALLVCRWRKAAVATGLDRDRGHIQGCKVDLASTRVT